MKIRASASGKDKRLPVENAGKRLAVGFIFCCGVLLAACDPPPPGSLKQVRTPDLSVDGLHPAVLERMTSYLVERSDASLESLLALRDGPVATSSFNPSGTRIVSTAGLEFVRIRDIKNGETLSQLRSDAGSFNWAAYNPEGSRIVTGSWDGTIGVWDAANGTLLAELKGHKGRVNSAVFSPDGTRIMSASGDKTARIWDSVPYRDRYNELKAMGLR